jgi:hypothetical protein
MHTSRFEKICSLKTYKVYIEKYGQTCLYENRDVINNLTQKHPDIFHIHVDLHYLFRMCLHTLQPDDFGIISIKINNIKNMSIAHGGNSLELLELILDNKEVARCIYAERYTRWLTSVSGNQGYNSKIYVDKTKADVVSIMKEKAHRARQTQLDKLAKDPLYFKKMSPLSPHYDGNKWTKLEIEDLYNKTLAVGTTPAAIDKRRAAHKKRIDEYGPIVVGKPSKAAKKFFMPIAKFLNDESVVYNWGYDGNSEWWVRDCIDKTKYYFIDFCCVSLNLAIEFHGTTYHPKSKDDENYRPPPFVKHQTASEKYAEDIRKADSIRKSGFTLFVVFEDDDLPKKLNEILEWITQKLLKTT